MDNDSKTAIVYLAYIIPILKMDYRFGMIKFKMQQEPGSVNLKEVNSIISVGGGGNYSFVWKPRQGYIYIYVE